MLRILSSASYVLGYLLNIHRLSRSQQRLSLLMSLLFVAQAATAAPSGRRMIEEIQTGTSDGMGVIGIKFTAPIHYRRHAPLASGNSLRIWVDSIASRRGQGLLPQKGTLRWTPSEAIPLAEVSYEYGQAGGGRLLLRFRKTVQYQVSPGDDASILNVTLADSVRPAETPDRGGLTSVPAAVPVAATVGSAESNVVPNSEALKASAPFEEIPAGGVASAPVESAGSFSSADRKVAPTEAALLAAAPPLQTAAGNTGTPIVLAAATGAASAPAKAAPSTGNAPCSTVLGSEASAAELREGARQCMIKEDWAGAIGLYTKLVQQPDKALQQEAQEMLGLARERNGQPSRAKAEYEKYLSLYPEGEGAVRVRQRLEGLLTANQQPQERLKAARPEGGKPFSETNGSFSQYYFRDAQITDKGDIVDQSLFLSNLDVTSRLRTDRFDVRAQLDARYRENFLPVLYNETDQFRVSNLFVDVVDRQLSWSGRLGRQSRSSGGVLGRFDGAVLSYRFAPQWQATVVGGLPVLAYRSTTPNTDKSFEGISLEYGPFAQYWAGNVFFINQIAQGKTDRRAVGGELRYQHPVHPVTTLVDYDVYFNALNTTQVLANWNFTNGAIVTVTADYRKTPYLSSSNALIGWGSGFGPGSGAGGGSGVSSITDILLYQPSIDLKSLALDNTPTLKTASVGGIVPLVDKLQFNGDITVTDLSATRGSPWITAYQGSGVQVSYSGQLIASSLLREGDVWNFGLRYSTQQINDIASVFVDGRYPVNEKMRLDPRFRVDYFTGFAGPDVYRIRPGVRLNYNLFSKTFLELETGFEYSNQPVYLSERDAKSYYISAGYRFDF